MYESEVHDRSVRGATPRWRLAGLIRTAFRTLHPALERLPRGTGVVATAAIIGASIAYGTVRGDHIQDSLATYRGVRDAFANAAGFRIADVTLTGALELTREQVLALAGIGGHSSLLFLDADAAREQLKSNPWIADATILKLYPDRLNISIVERKAFALWQKDGKISVIAADGTVIQTAVDERFANLPLVVGRGADKRANEFLTLLDRFPTLREGVRASILVADRRWNLKMRNGLDVRLPESDPGAALDALIGLDRDKKILTRDIAVVDLRLPDRVTVQLSDAAAQARDEANKDRKAKRKGGDA